MVLYYPNSHSTIPYSENTPCMFADDASVLITRDSPMQFKNIINVVYGILEDWFVKNLFSLNKTKTRCINFTAKNNMLVHLSQ
jgi:hypothetical protein